jgi:FkbM family methyltransferase
VRDGPLEMLFDEYPYLAFFDIEGYVNHGSWRPRIGETVIDAGGCHGEFSLYASKCVGSGGRVIMLEPDPANIAVARELFQLNGNPKNIEIIPCGLWSQPGKLRFRAGAGAESAIVFEDETDPAPQGKNDIEIKVHSLRSLAEELHLDRLDFIKMDIEGAELEVISTASELAPQFKPRYAIASYHMINGVRTADTLANIFPQMGYHVRAGYPNHLTTWASPVPIDSF